ncbi:chorismate mutase [Martelella alba]|uniref:chorismate mutase n=1 Tax=Martelella alba TaxID=2590451 RepID=A0ABY2SHN5_9HYPH|nr:chorismate mutase [Martelella alba]TKI04610.1 chorismate mutase family protein [Martelella alba]
MENFRKEIDVIDRKLVELLAKRLDICREIARFKSDNDLPVMQPGRLSEVKRRTAELAMVSGLNLEFINTLYNHIINEACRIENAIISISGVNENYQQPDSGKTGGYGLTASNGMAGVSERGQPRGNVKYDEHIR